MVKFNASKYFVEWDIEKGKERDRTCIIKHLNEYESIKEYNFTIKELEDIMNRLRIPRPTIRKKKSIAIHCYNYMFLHLNIIRIQKCWRNHFIRLFNKSLGPAFYRRSLSTNIDDFMTLDSIKNIDYYYFFSYKDKDNFVYTFHLSSIYNLITKNILKNPYNRATFGEEFIQSILRRKRYNQVLRKIQDIDFDYVPPVPPQLSNSQRVIRIFNKIEDLGNYVNSRWFLCLRREELCKFLYELYDIWFYRASLTPHMRNTICPPNGNPFDTVNHNTISHMQTFDSLRNIQKVGIEVMERLVFRSPETSNQNLGALYILSALTLVSTDAREALPWLYSSVSYN